MFSFKKRLDELDRLKLGAKEVVLRVDTRKWCKIYYSPSIKCDSVDNNSCEAFNFVFVGSRSKPIITMLEETREFVVE